MEAVDRQAAPGRLELVREFVNTYDAGTLQEELDSPEQLRLWLIGHGLLADERPVSGPELERALSAREALRDLILASNRRMPGSDALETLNRLGKEASLTVRFEQDGSSELEPAVPGVNGAIGRMLAIVYASMVDGTWSRLKACEACEWAYYDRSKNRSRTWCSMDTCGSRNKARAYRRRRRTHG